VCTTVDDGRLKRDETQTWKTQDLSMNFHRMKPDTHSKPMDTMSQKFVNLHTSLSDAIKKLMKQPVCKDRLLLWMRRTVVMNHDKQKH